MMLVVDVPESLFILNGGMLTDKNLARKPITKIAMATAVKNDPVVGLTLERVSDKHEVIVTDTTRNLKANISLVAAFDLLNVIGKDFKTKPFRWAVVIQGAVFNWIPHFEGGITIAKDNAEPPNLVSGNVYVTFDGLLSFYFGMVEGYHVYTLGTQWCWYSQGNGYRIKLEVSVEPPVYAKVYPSQPWNTHKSVGIPRGSDERKAVGQWMRKAKVGSVNGLLKAIKAEEKK